MDDGRRDALLLLTILIGLFALKHDTLDNPYYWDAMSGIIDQSLSLLNNSLHPRVTGMWGHPPMQHYQIAVLWVLFGTSLPIAHTYILVVGAIGLFYTFKCGQVLFNSRVGYASMLLLLSSQIYFAQLGIINDSIPLATTGIMTFYYYLKKKKLAYVISASVMLSTKETSGILLLAICLHYFLEKTMKGGLSAGDYVNSLYLAIPLLPLLAWMGYIYGVKGWVFRTDLGLNRDVAGWIFARNIIKYFIYDHTPQNVTRWNFIPTIFIILALKRRRSLKALTLAMIVLLYNGLFALTQDIPRYYTPALPFYFMLAAYSMHSIIKSDKKYFLAIALMIGLSATNFHGTRDSDGWMLESNMEYADALENHAEGARYLERQARFDRIITCWPMSEQLGEPMYGYVNKPVRNTQTIINQSGRTLVYYSRQSSCRHNPRYIALINGSRLLKRFERNGKLAEVYEMTQSFP
ncbi:ArnT family glycosyltransferase [Candidatus Altiarchaeota archaeon]